MADRFSSARRAAKDPSLDLLFKGILCAAIGLAVLIGPSFMGASPMRDTVGQSAVVGWFALALGVAFIVQFVWRRKSTPRPPADRP